MTALLVLMLVAVVGSIGFAWGSHVGRTAKRRSAPATKVEQESAYQAGYLAGHLAGWRDAVTAAARHQAGGVHQVQSAAPADLPALPLPGSGGLPLPAPQSPLPMPTAAAPAGQLPPLATPVPQPAHGLAPAPKLAPSTPAVVSPAPVHPAPAQLVPPRPAPFTPVQETPEEAAARKARRDQQNINVTLYVASLLLVAAGALFVGTSLPVPLRFAGICGITALFYGAGLVIHRRVPRLKPAAVAFVGTGLALVPILGLAMYNFAFHHGPAAWLITSLVGTGAYVYAALRLDSKVLAFLSLTFMVSTAWSGVSILGGALVWYFTALIGVAIISTVVALVQPRWIPPLFLQPLAQLHPFVVPLAAVAVTCVPHLLGKGEYPLVMAMCGAYFAVMVAVPGVRYRIQHFHAARIALTLALLGLVWDLSEDATYVMLAAVIALGGQAVGVSLAGRRIIPGSWWNDAVSCLGLQSVIAAVLAAVLALQGSGIPTYLPFVVCMVTAMACGWKLGHGAEFAPGGVLAVIVPFVPVLDAWSVAALAGSAAVYWFARAAISAPYRKPLVLAARVALTFSVPAIVAGALDGSPDRSAYVVLAAVLASAAQQVVGAVLEHRGVRLAGPQASAASFGGAALAGLPVLSWLDGAAGKPLVVAGVSTVVAAGLLAGLCLVLRPRISGEEPAGSKPSPPRPTIAELLGPVTAAVGGVIGFVTVSLTLGNTVLLALTGYLVLLALRLPDSSRRRNYWWFARGAATVLAVSAYADAVRHGWSPRIAGEIPSAALVLILLAAGQLLLPLLPATRRRSPDAARLDAGLLLLVMGAAASFLTAAGVWGAPLFRHSWQPGVAALVTAAAAVTAGFFLRRVPATWVMAPAALALLLLLRSGDVGDVEALLGVFSLYGIVMVFAVQPGRVQGAYLVAARVLTAALITVLAADLTDSPAAASLALATVLVLQPALVLLFRGRLRDLPYQRGAAWAVLAAQLAVPLAYLAIGNHDAGGRWVVLLELALVPASAAIMRRVQELGGAMYFGVASVAALVVAAGPAVAFPANTWLSEPILDRYQGPLVFLGLAVAVVGAQAFLQRRKRTASRSVVPAERWLWLVAALLFTLLGGLLTLDVSYSLTGLAVLVLALVLFVASHLLDMPSLYAAAAPSALVGAVPAAEGLLGPGNGAWAVFMPWLVGGVGLAALLYPVRWFGGAGITDQPWRRNGLAGTAVGALAASAAIGLASDPTALTAAGLVMVAGVIVVIEVPHGRWLAGEVAGLVSLAAVQRAVLFVGAGSPEWFWAAQWYVVAGAVLAGLRYFKGQRHEARWRLGVTAGVLALTSLGTVLGGTPSQQVYVLAAHVLLLVAGLLLAERMFVWWGAAGVALSIMWALRSYAFAMLALVALALIVVAVWRLNRKPPAAPDGAQESPGYHVESRPDRIR